MSIQIPDKEKRFIQPNNSTNGGNLYSTFNCDFDSNGGVLQVAKKMLMNVSKDDVAEITDVPVGFRYFNNGSNLAIYTIAGTANAGCVFSSLAASASFSKVATSGSPTTLDSSTCDIETAFGNLYITSSSEGKVYFLNGSNAWSSFSAGAAGSTAMLCFSPALQRMFITKNGNQIQSFDSTHTVVSPTATNALQLGTNEVITFMRAVSNGLWIGTVNTLGGKGYMYFWNGSDTQVSTTGRYRLEAAGALACVIKDDVPWIVDSNGNLLKWNGGTFELLTGFYRKYKKQFYNTAQNLNIRWIHPNGIAIIDNLIHINVDLTNNDAASHAGTQEDCNPSGIWVYDPIAKCLKHKYAFTLGKSATTPIKDYGQFRIRSAGGIGQLVNTANISNGTILAGASVYKDASTFVPAIFYDDTADTIQKAASIVLPIINSEGLSDMWGKAYAFHDMFANATDRMIVKVRHQNFATSLEGAISWLTTSSFSTALDLTNYNKGDEVDILTGVGAGMPSHIKTKQKADGVWLITLDEVYLAVVKGATSTARFVAWKKIGQFDDDEDANQAPIDNAAARVQMKLWMQWTGVNELSRMVITNSVSKPIA